MSLFWSRVRRKNKIDNRRPAAEADKENQKAMSTPLVKSHRFRIVLTRTVLILCSALTLCLSAASAQQGSPGSTDKSGEAGNPKPAGTQSDSAKTPLTAEEKKHADLLADTEKLYKLTQELKAEVAKSNKDTLSVSVVKKAQEVERLAKSIKERSRN
jgi:hypothetical protein